MWKWVPLLVTLFACGSKDDAQPVADAGPDQLVTPGVTVALDGTNSSDRDGRIKNYAWTQISAPPSSTEPFEGSGATPTFEVDAIGRYVFSLSVTDDAGNLSHPDLVEIVSVSPSERPLAIMETDGNLGLNLEITLDGSQSTAPEGETISTWNFSLIHSPSDSSARLEETDSPDRMTLTPDAPGLWLVGLEVSDGELFSRVVTKELQVSSQPNQPPVALCGGHREVEIGSLVRIDGSASIDPEGRDLSYTWTLTGPPESASVVINTEAREARFVADVEGNFIVELVVSDGILQSTPCSSTVAAVLDTENQGPIANAGSDQAFSSAELPDLYVNLDGSDSFDPNGDPLTYEWSMASVPADSVLSDAAFSAPTAEATLFTPDVNGPFVVVLNVCDPQGLCASDSALIYVGEDANQAPVANAGPDSIVEARVEARLDGTSSSDPDGDALSYTWTILARPATSSALINGADDAQASITPDAEGEYVLQLEVSDGTLSSTDLLNLTAFPIGTPLAPICAEIEDKITDMGVGVSISASDTTDPNGDALTYSWVTVSEPSGANPSIVAATDVETTFIPDLPGDYRVQMTASDESESCTVEFGIEAIDTSPNQAPICDSGGDLAIELGDTAILDGSGTSDPDGDALTYEWYVYESPGAAPPDIVGATLEVAEFTPETTGVYTLSFNASDGEESCSQWLVVDVQAATPNTPPDCTLVGAASAVVDDTLLFDASGTSDADGDDLTITWTVERPAASTSILVPDGFTASIPADVPGDFTVSIDVSDGEANCTASSTTTVNSENSAPECVVTGPEESSVGEPAIVDAGGSSDPDGDLLSYAWTIVEKPPESSTDLTATSAEAVSFIPDTPGEYVLGVTVSDGSLSCASNVAVLATEGNTPPTCNAGADVDTTVGTFVDFDGSETTDLDGDTLTYYWYVIERPEGSSAGLVGRESPTPRFQPDVEGLYVLEITADDGSDSCSDTVELTAIENLPPSCDAGPDISGLVGEFADFDASGSSDPDGDALTYYWSVVERPEGSGTGLVSRETATPRFQPDVAGTYTLEVSVSDGLESCTDTVILEASSNTAPTCSAGPDLVGAPLERSTLDGSATSDPDGDALTYYWYVTSRPEGSVHGLIDRESPTAAFIPDLEGTYTFEITASDGTESCSATVTLDVPANTPPTCSAGADIEGDRFVRVDLDGSATTDDDGDTLTYYWNVTSRPEGSVHGLFNRETATAAFIPDLSGTYIFEITASDGTDSCSDTMTLTVSSGSAPSCDAGPDQLGEVGTRIDFDGTGTSDPDGDSLSYYWYVRSRPETSIHGLIRRETATPAFIPDVAGEYTFEVTASDGENTCSDDMTVTVSGTTTDDTASPPIGDDTASPPPDSGDVDADAGRDQSLCDIDTIDLDGTDSSGTSITYSWTFDSIPSGSSLTDSDIDDADSPLASFTPDAEGRFVIQLAVSDGDATDSDTVAITVDTAGSVLTLHLDEGAGTSTADSSPYENDSSALDADWTGGRFFTGMAFDGTNQISFADADQLDIQSNFTIDWWMRTSDIGEDWRAILTKGTESNYNYSVWTYQDELHFYGVDTSGAYISTSAASTTIGDGSWHHYAVTVTGSVMTLYEDGSVLSSSTFTNPLQTNATDLYIGRPAYSSTVDTFVGSLDEIVIRAEVLTSAEIAFISESDTQYCTGDEDTRTPVGEITSPAAPTSTDIGYVKVEGTASDESAIASVTVNGSTAAPTSDDYATWVAYVPITEGSNTLSLRVEDVAGNVNSSADSVSVERNDFCGDDTVLLLAFDEDEAGTATDWGPGGNDGSETGVARMIGRYGNALDVNAAGNVTVPHDSTLGSLDEFSLEMWMRRDGPTSDLEVLAAKGEPATFGMLLFTDTLLFGFDDEDGTEWAATASGVTDGDWHHVVGVFDGTELALYVDGSLAGNTPTFGATPTTNTSGVTIGSFYGAGGFLDGQIDQLHLFDGALSASEVVDQYSAGESCPLGDNLALAASASASSTLNPLFRADNVVDDNTREAGIADYTMWLGEEGASGWVTLDFGSVVGILRVRWANTHNRLSYDRATRDYRIEASTTGAFGDEAISIASGTGSLEDDLIFHTEESTPVAARYLRFYSDTFVGAGPGLNEIQVYGLE